MTIRSRPRSPRKVASEIFVVQCSSAEEPVPVKRPFGPFVEVPADQVKPAGFACQHCKGSVEVLRQTLPGMVPRLCVYACRCGAVVVWEDEAQPKDAKHWYWNMKALRKARVRVAIFNGNRPLSPDFSGLN